MLSVWFLAAWIGIVGGVSLADHETVYAAGFLAFGLITLGKVALALHDRLRRPSRLGRSPRG